MFISESKYYCPCCGEFMSKLGKIHACPEWQSYISRITEEENTRDLIADVIKETFAQVPKFSQTNKVIV